MGFVLLMSALIFIEDLPGKPEVFSLQRNFAFTSARMAGILQLMFVLISLPGGMPH